jgi:hypothetical protein
MNIFDILSAGKRDLNEENISAFLGWLLDPLQSHGMGTLFLERFLKMVDVGTFQPYLELMLGKVNYREAAPLRVSVILENRVPVNSTIRDIDILLLLESERLGNRFVLIENKIRGSAISRNQLQEELQGFLNGEYKIEQKDVTFVYITTAPVGMEAFNLLPSSISKAHLLWKGEGANSIEGLIRGIIQEETNAQINPLTADTIQILKSFVQFSQKEFRNKPSWASSASRERSEYYKGVAYGSEALEELIKTEPEAYVGIAGGMGKLREQPLNYLLERTYKWDTDMNRGNKNINNWAKIGEVIDAIKHAKTEGANTL